jgi:hypothetical protein
VATEEHLQVPPPLPPLSAEAVVVTGIDVDKVIADAVEVRPVLNAEVVASACVAQSIITLAVTSAAVELSDAVMVLELASVIAT